jgi:hypothetical protein
MILRGRLSVRARVRRKTKYLNPNPKKENKVSYYFVTIKFKSNDMKGWN